MLDCGKIEGLILHHVNEGRKKEGLDYLKNNPRLTNIARQHSHKMAHAKHIWHGNGVHLAGGSSGENVALMYTGRVHGFNHEIRSCEDVAWALYHNWMHSPGHRSNIMNSNFNMLGIGVVANGNGYYATQLFKESSFGIGIPVPRINKKIFKKILSFLLWWLTFGIGLWLAGLIISLIELPNTFLVALFFGFVIETISKISQRIRFGSKFKIDKGFIWWIILQSFIFLIVTNLLKKSDISLVSLGITLVVYGAWKLDTLKNKFIIDFIMWWITFTIGVLIVENVILNLPPLNKLLIALIIGFILETISKFIQLLRFNHEIRIDKQFALWVLILAVCYQLIAVLLDNLPIRLVTNFWHSILIGLLITVVINGIWRMNIHRRLLITSVILIVLLYFLTIGNARLRETIPIFSDIKDNLKVRVNEIKEDLDQNSEKNTQKRLKEFEYEGIEVFNHLNDLRYEKGLSRMEWDVRAYDMAVSRSKDMYGREYFSHLTPEGDCMLTLKSKFGFKSDEVVAENLGGMTHYGNNEPIASTSVYEPLESWIKSPGHNANLFYPKHIKGAIGCYKAICVFNGVHNDPYGLGAAPCSMYE